MQAPPLSPYALQKIQAEEYAALYWRLHGISSLGLRYFNVYGEGQDPSSTYSGVISRFLSAYGQRKPITIYGSGEQSRDFIHVSDVARANVLALESDYHGAVNVANGHPQNLLQLIDYIQSAGGKPVARQFKLARPGDIAASYGSTAQAHDCIGFSSAILLKEGIKRMVECEANRLS